MAFSTFPYYLFLALVVIVNYLLPARKRWIWLLICSYFFYGLFDLRSIPVLLACTQIAYTIAPLIESSSDVRKKKTWLAVGVSSILLILFLFQYYSFFLDSINPLISMLGFHWTLRGIQLFFPLGISFYCFQLLSYIWDVHNKRIPAEKNIGYLAFYAAFFPKLLSGPIERYAAFKEQFPIVRTPAQSKTTDHLLRIGWGLAKKMIIADRLAVVADRVFSSAQNFSSLQLVIGVLAFSFQIYLDFSAYTDIAIGSAGLLGIDLSENFNRPYFATSVIDFWRRWHMTLSNWLRDYVFIKLEYKNRRRKPRIAWTAVDIFITFLISGLWHGANWTFVVWGMLHGFYQAVEILTQKIRDRWVEKLRINRDSLFHQAFQILLTFALVSFGWIFFKADSLDKADIIIQSIFSLDGFGSAGIWQLYDKSLGLDIQDFTLMLVALGLYFIVETLQGKYDLYEFIKQWPGWLRWLLYYVLFFAVTILGYYGDVTGINFVYFQF